MKNYWKVWPSKLIEIRRIVLTGFNHTPNNQYESGQNLSKNRCTNNIKQMVNSAMFKLLLKSSSVNSENCVSVLQLFISTPPMAASNSVQCQNWSVSSLLDIASAINEFCGESPDASLDIMRSTESVKQNVLAAVKRWKGEEKRTGMFH